LEEVQDIMAEASVAAYGSWKSPISADLVVAGGIALGWPMAEDGTIHWTEGRPTEAGRVVLVRRLPDGQIRDVTPAPFNVRTRVHEYGGGAYLVSDGVAYFSHFADQRLYALQPGGIPQPVSRDAHYRYADGVADPGRKRLILVREDHSIPGQEAVNTLVSLSMDGSDEQVLATGYDFYSNPRLNPDATQLAWLSWRHPNMPWDGCELWVAPVNTDGSLGTAALVAGGKGESIFQPEWSPEGVLHWASDRTGWWNLYRQAGSGAEALYPMDAEFGQPAWSFGTRTYTFAGDSAIVCTYTQHGRDFLARLDPATRSITVYDLPFTSIQYLFAVNATTVGCIAGSPTSARALVQLDVASGVTQVVRQSSTVSVDEAYISVPESVSFPTENGLTAFGLFYPPRNKDFTAPAGERPPLLVKSHGGPTGATSAVLNLIIQYWTSRGVAVFDVNYGGSTGYGRPYRERLKGQWGIVDLDDCVNGARYLAEQGRVDGERLAIDGGSAGGYTTLAVLTFRGAFKAGASYYGVSDLEALATDTHKFESRYLDGLVAPYPAGRDVYLERSPIHHVDRLARPLILFQGLEDKVVPPDQAEKMSEAVKSRGLPVAYIPFEGEQHGFRKAENIKRALEAEFAFFARIFGYEPADRTQPFPIANIDPTGA
jgi:dipeptidyl aminopeptidase/acylaminoacyl peptidase